MRFIKNNLSTYINAKHKKEIKIFGNPFTKNSFYTHFRSLFKCRKFYKVDFQKFVVLEESLPIDESNNNNNDNQVFYFLFFILEFLFLVNNFYVKNLFNFHLLLLSLFIL